MYPGAMTEHGCKVCRVLAERDLEHLNGEMVARWHGETGDRMGYRRLADWLNTSLLRAEMEIVGMPTEGGEPRSRYERLTGTDGSSGDKVAEQMRGVLRRGGVAVEELIDDFVSYGVIRTHLRECLGERRDPQPPADWEADRLAQLEAYTGEEAADAVRSLVNKGKLSAGGEVQVTVSLAVTCSECGVAVPYEEAIDTECFCDCSS